MLGNTDIAAVATYVPNAWGNAAQPVSELDVVRLR
jgi:mono/diheme cytochrome c family protein